MAKKIDASKQGNNYLTSLLGDRAIVPLDGGAAEEIAAREEPKKEQATVPVTKPAAEYPSRNIPFNDDVQEIEIPGRKKLGRKRYGEALKVGLCVSIDQNLLNDLKKIAFVNRLKVSNIIEEHVSKYVAYHSQDIEEFERLPEKVKELAGI